MKTGFYAGSFDPFTNGHLQVVKKAVDLFDEVIVAIGVNPDKTRRFDKDVMKKAIEDALFREELNNVRVITYSGATMDAANEHESLYLVRGIRNGFDYEEEEKGACVNEEFGSIDTVYFRAGKLGIVSSSLVMELRKYGKDVSQLVPKEILDVMEKEAK